ncbi:hypothetical protein T06_9561 [Trichinella sp. T6]|nr:hypothetical protein T06_9561 [Trichinella sp. T6]
MLVCLHQVVVASSKPLLFGHYLLIKRSISSPLENLRTNGNRANTTTTSVVRIRAESVAPKVALPNVGVWNNELAWLATGSSCANVATRTAAWTSRAQRSSGGRPSAANSNAPAPATNVPRTMEPSPHKAANFGDLAWLVNRRPPTPTSTEPVSVWQIANKRRIDRDHLGRGAIWWLGSRKKLIASSSRAIRKSAMCTAKLEPVIRLATTRTLDGDMDQATSRKAYGRQKKDTLAARATTVDSFQRLSVSRPLQTTNTGSACETSTAPFFFTRSTAVAGLHGVGVQAEFGHFVEQIAGQGGQQRVGDRQQQTKEESSFVKESAVARRC